MNTVRTVAATKASFFTHYARPISSVYRRVVEELLIELHLVTVSRRFVYDPFFALGIVTVFDSLMQGYEPPDQVDLIFTALCQSLQLKPDVIRQDAKKLLELVGSGDRHQRLQLLNLEEGVPDVGGVKGMLTAIRDNSDFGYSRTFLLGLYGAFQAVADPAQGDKDKTKEFQKIAKTLNLPVDRVDKDLDVYRTARERMAQAQDLRKDLAEVARQKREKQAAASTAPVEPKPASAPDAGPTPPAA